MKSEVDRSVRLLVAVGDDLSRVLQQPQWLEEWGGEIIPARDNATALVLIRQLSPALVIVSCRVTCPTTLEFIRDIRAISADVPVVVVSEDSDAKAAISFIHAGASDHIIKPLDKKVFTRLIEGLKFEEVSRNQRHQRLFCQSSSPGVEVVGQSAGITKCLEMVRLVSESKCNPVLILGETGTGKELVARSAHWWRYGDFEQFIAVNCATLTANLMASELFGHSKGAFTGADREKTGLFEEADNGSIFLDEISEMPLELQAQLLRVIQERSFRKVGATRDTKCNATILASSNKDLLKEVQAGRFRQDLYYRLAVLPITVPTLRSEDRRDDILLLAEYFLESSLTPRPNGTLRLGKDAGELLRQYHWPGNVRELRNVIERAIILEKTDEISASNIVFDQQLEEAKVVTVKKQPCSQHDFSLETAEREFIQRALEETGWQRTRAAALLGITRATLYAKLKRYDIKAPDGQQAPDSTDQQGEQTGSSVAPDDPGVSEKRTVSA
ncbi:MAG: sigma-54-dependent Fis family transcriptional regulator [bacterium]|nr:sigma-54-dependent Fis family transcriptional regulator [bacterium]